MEEDVIEKLTVADAAFSDITPLNETDPVGKAVMQFSDSENMAYPVVNAEGELIGMLTLSHLKDILLDSDIWTWMVVADVLVPGKRSVPETMELKDAILRMDESGLEQIPVVKAGDKEISAGILDRQHIRKVIQQEMIRVQSGN